MNWNTCLLFFVLVGFSCSGGGPKQFDPNQASEWKTYDHPEFQFAYPTSWTLVDSSANPSLPIQLFADIDEKGDDFLENVNIFIKDVPFPEYSLEDFSVDMLRETDELGAIFSGMQILLKETVEVNGKPCFRLISSGKAEMYNLKFEQYLWVHNGRTFELTFTAEALVFARYRDVWLKMVNGFVIL